MELIKFDKASLSKVGVESLATNILAALDNGSVNALELSIAFKSIEKVKEAIESKLKELALEEAQKYEGKTFTYLGNSIEISDSLGVKYDYSNCNHKEYAEVLEKLAPLLKRKTEIEKELQSMKSKRTELDESTGEIYEVYPPIKKATTGLKITLK